MCCLITSTKMFAHLRMIQLYLNMYLAGDEFLLFQDGCKVPLKLGYELFISFIAPMKVIRFLQLQILLIMPYELTI